MFKNENKKTTITEKEAKEALNANKKQAEELLKDVNKMDSFLGQVDDKFRRVTGIGDKIKDMKLVVKLIRSYMKKEYTAIPVGSIIGLVAALVYFVNPFDVIPDTIPGVGYLDDITVLGLAMRFAYSDIEDYKRWLQENGKY